VSKSDTILLVLEPVDATGGAAAGEAAGDVAGGTAQRALAAEAGRMAAALGAEVRRVTWPAGPEVDFDSLAAALADHVRKARAVAVLVQNTDSGRQLAPVLAHRLGTGAVLGCGDVVVRGDAAPPSVVFVKTVYGGWLEQEVTTADGFVPVVTLDLEGLEAPADAGDAADSGDLPATGERETVAYAVPPVPRIRHLAAIPPDARSVDLAHATRIVAAGMGSIGDDLLAAVHELADLLEGSVGATRPVVDEGYLPKERLIGQTGKTVAPELYVALGISGSPHHVAGVRKADRVLSVNRDVRAPIFQFSDVGYVADLEVVLPALLARIKEWRDAPAGDDRGE
jgi:electron transfer flavoprotein alpha subunit